MESRREPLVGQKPQKPNAIVLGEQLLKVQRKASSEMKQLAEMFGEITLQSHQQKEYGQVAKKMSQSKIAAKAFTIEDYRLLCSFDKLPKSNPAIQISTQSLKRIVLGYELNDEAINSQIALLRESLPADSSIRLLNSFFVGLLQKGNTERVFKKFRIEKECKLIIPVNLKGVHWITAVVHSGRIEVYDSMKYSGVPAILQSFFQKYYGKECKVEVGGFPKQDNLVDCGVFTLCGIEDLIHNREWTFSQADMLAKRLTLARGIMAKRQAQ